MLPQFVSAKRGNNSSQLTVISYNMRYGTAEDGVNAWEFRKPATIKMIKKHKPGIYNRLLLNILYVINQKYGLNL